ncbi:hypothetical protein DBR43_30495 [Pedobacter sp. KBW06]|uniref:hypothetical protein n=1 Tax=Pedobacter sp. KBW06 TaxID=2153359 RepID=UPI000F5921EE|nr:hypothetical protein [Pedobacter sp. KBW06]RQO65186.1 hypothetical protein DBR43_30495 [Pedobacter sp. KBW06]
MMKNLAKNIVLYFCNINYPALGKSTQEVLWMTVIAFIPLILNIIIASIQLDNIPGAFKEKIIPGEMLSYCLSFIAPSIYLLVKTHGTGYKLPLVKLFFMSTFIIYACTIALYLIAKNKWVAEINLEKHEFDLYFKLSMIFLSLTVIFRIYSIYHGSYSNWTATRNNQQAGFNNKFTASLNQSK